MAAPVSASAHDIGSGHEVGPYILTREIGKGSFAVVFQGKILPPSPQREDRSDSNDDAGPSTRTTTTTTATRPSSAVSRVAIKIVTRKKLTTKLLENLEGEISILRTVRHSNIVELLDCLKTDSHIYLVMQYCRMGDLSNFIRTRRRSGDTAASAPGGGRERKQQQQQQQLSASQQNDKFEEEMNERYQHPHDGGLHGDVTRSFLAQLAGALQFMRSRNIVHRDIKPQNLLLQEPESDMIAQGHPNLIPQLKVADFGFARHLEAASLAETLCGSPLYMAPEILRYEKYDAKADLWSVGAVLFEMCVGKAPFRASNHVELLRKIERGEDKIKFPDERSDDSLRREQMRRNDDGKQPKDVVRPHVVDDDVKRLIRQLLRRRPIERLGFEDFFNCDVLQDYKERTKSSSSVPSLSPSPSPTGSGIVPIAKRVAPAVPSNVAPHRNSNRSSGQTHDLLAGEGAKADTPLNTAPITGLRHYFAPKYVVGGLKSPRAGKDEVKAEEGSATKNAETKERPKATSTIPSRLTPTEVHEGEASSLEDNVLETPGSSVSHLPATVQSHKAPQMNQESTSPSVAREAEGSIKARRSSSYGDDDRGYVMVEKRNLDVNAMTEDFNNKARLRPGAGWSPLGAVRRPSQLGRLASLSGAISPLSGLGTTTATTSTTQNLPAAQTSPTGTANVNQSPTFAKTSSPVQARFSSTPPNAPFALPANARKPSFSRKTSTASDGVRPSLVRPSASSAGSTTTNVALSGSGAGSAFPTQASFAPSRTSLVQDQTTAAPSVLSRAISMASIRLFGVPTNLSMRGAGVRRSLRMGLGTGTLLSSSPSQAIDANMLAAADVAEQNLLSLLHEYGQKSFVLSEFADARLAAFFTYGPHQNNYIERRRTSSSSLSSMTNGAATIATKTTTSTTATNNTTTSSVIGESSRASLTSSEVAASEAYVLYVRSLSFLQRAMDAARAYLEARFSSSSASRYVNASLSASSQDVHEAMQWLRAKFNDGVERANFARAKSVEDMPESAQYIDKMIFEEALEVARRAAVDELENNRADDLSWNAERCLLAYETACTMLQSLLDPPEPTKDLSQSAVGTIKKFIDSISQRMSSIQRKLEMQLTTTPSTSLTA